MKKILLSLFTVGVLLPIGLSGSNNDFSYYQKVDASSVTARYIYIDLSNNSKYLEDGAEPHLIYKVNNEFTLSEVDTSNHIFKTNVTIDPVVLNEGFTVECFDGAYKSDLVTFSNDYYNIVTIGNDYSVLGYGQYGNRIDNPGATYRTQRVWLYSESSHEYGVRYVYEDLTKEIEMLSIVNTFDGKNYYYADIPYSANNVTFLELSNYVIYKETKIDRLSYGICYSLSEDGYSYIRVPNADATILSMVVEAYLTYGKDDSNGCTLSTVKSLFSTWFVSKSASKDSLKATKIWDYTGYAANGNSYEGLEKNAQFSVNEKWNTMCAQAGIDSNTGEERNNFIEWIKEHKKLVIIIGILTLGVVAGVIFLFVLKKKKARQ